MSDKSKYRDDLFHFVDSVCSFFKIQYSYTDKAVSDLDENADYLIAAWEYVLEYGLKTNKKVFKSNRCKYDFLPVLDNLTNKEFEIDRNLKYVNTDYGIAKSTVRKLFNEGLLESTIRKLEGNSVYLYQYYEEYSVLFHEEYRTLLPSVAAKLSAIYFSFNTDKSTLDDKFSINISVLPDSLSMNEYSSNMSSNQNSQLEKMKPIVENRDIDCMIKKKTKNIIKFDFHGKGTSKNKLIPAKSIDMSTYISSTTNLNTYTNSINTINTPINSYTAHYQNSTPTSKVSIGSENTAEKKIDSATDTECECTQIDCSDTNAKISETNQNLQTEIKIQRKIMKDYENKKNQLLQRIEKLDNHVVHLESKNKEIETNYFIVVNELIKCKKKIEIMDKSYKQGSIGLEKLYEKKIVQLSNMHAELMDFNFSLHKKIKLINQKKQNSLISYGYMDVNVSCAIPRVDHCGKIYYVYEIKVNVNKDEWKVYRRYSDFYNFHHEMCTKNKIFHNLHLPNKEIFNKNSKVLKTRIHQLQNYLQRMLILSIVPPLKKESLLKFNILVMNKTDKIYCRSYESSV